MSLASNSNRGRRRGTTRLLLLHTAMIGFQQQFIECNKHSLLLLQSCLPVPYLPEEGDAPLLCPVGRQLPLPSSRNSRSRSSNSARWVQMDHRSLTTNGG